MAEAAYIPRTSESMAAEHSTPEEMELKKAEMRDRIVRTMKHSAEQCTTMDELFKLQETATALCGLIVETKRGTDA